jgi:hypothetical protein
MAARRDKDGSRHPEILLEVRSKSAPGDLGPGRATLEQFERRAGEIADSIAEIAEEFRSKLEKTLRTHDHDHDHSGGWHTDSVELGFDIVVQAEAGVVIAKAVTGATFSAKLTLKAPASDQ